MYTQKFGKKYSYANVNLEMWPTHITHTCTHICTHTYIDTHMHTHTRAHAHTCTHTPAYTHTPAHTHTHTHMHTPTRWLPFEDKANGLADKTEFSVTDPEFSAGNLTFIVS